MAISPNFAFNLTLEDIVKQACQRVGVLGAGDAPTGPQIIMCRDFLNVNLKALQAEGVILRTVERLTKPLVAGVAAYALDADTIDVQFPASVVLSTSGRDSLVVRMVTSEYSTITNKVQAGTPTQMLVEKQALVTVTLWPIPDASVTALKYTRVRLIRDIDAGYNPDVATRWLKTLVLQLAADLGEHFWVGDAKIQRLRNEYLVAKKEAVGSDSESGDVQFVLGGW